MSDIVHKIAEAVARVQCMDLKPTLVTMSITTLKKLVSQHPFCIEYKENYTYRVMGINIARSEDIGEDEIYVSI